MQVSTRRRAACDGPPPSSVERQAGDSMSLSTPSSAGLAMVAARSLASRSTYPSTPCLAATHRSRREPRRAQRVLRWPCQREQTWRIRPIRELLAGMEGTGGRHHGFGASDGSQSRNSSTRRVLPVPAGAITLDHRRPPFADRTVCALAVWSQVVLAPREAAELAAATSSCAGQHLTWRRPEPIFPWPGHGSHRRVERTR